MARCAKAAWTRTRSSEAGQEMLYYVQYFPSLERPNGWIVVKRTAFLAYIAEKQLKYCTKYNKMAHSGKDGSD